MLVGVEIGLALWGLLFGVLRGRAPLSPLPAVVGRPARVIGVVAMLPLPVSLALGYLWAWVAARRGWQLTPQAVRPLAVAIEVSLILLALASIYYLGYRASKRSRPGR